MERVGFYHDVTGKAIDTLFTNNQLKREFHPVDDPNPSLSGQAFIYKNTRPNPTPKSNALSSILKRQSTNSASGLMAQAIVFVAIAQTIDATPACHILQPDMCWVDGYKYKLDIPITIPNEVHNIEVKNGLAQLAPTSTQIKKFLAGGNHGFVPDLICRMATVGTKKGLIRKNGLVTELERLILIDVDDAPTHLCKQAASLLKIEDRIHFNSPITLGSNSYDGAQFLSSIHKEKLTMDQLKSIGPQVPQFIQHKMNGMIRLITINERFREAYLYPEGKRATKLIMSLLMQHSYKTLVDNAPQQYEISSLFANAAGTIRQPLLSKLNDDKQAFQNQFDEEWETLKFINFVSKRSDHVWIDDARRLEQWLKTESNSPTELCDMILG